MFTSPNDPLVVSNLDPLPKSPVMETGLAILKDPTLIVDPTMLPVTVRLSTVPEATISELNIASC